MILKIRDAEGNVQEILAIRGEDGKDGANGADGKDYVLTEKDKQEIAAIVSAGAVSLTDLIPDTSGFALKTEIPDVSGFALKTEIPDVSGFALKTDIPDVSGYALKTEIPDVSGFAKKTEIPSVPTNVSAFANDAGYLTQHQSLADYAKKTDLPNMGNYYSKDDLDPIIESADERLNGLENPNTEAWTFTLEDGSTVTKTVVLK